MSTTTSNSNGTADAIPRQSSTDSTDTPEDAFDATTLPEYQDYRPTAPDIDDLFQEIARSLSAIVTQAFYKAERFMNFAQHFDKDAPAHIRAAHMADMNDCLEVARTYMRLWQEVLGAQRLIVEERFSLTDKKF
jgi:hypothetical protein